MLVFLFWDIMEQSIFPLLKKYRLRQVPFSPCFGGSFGYQELTVRLGLSPGMKTAPMKVC
jgi:hypothetical protein